ncbi:hypothetical protein HHX48_16300 [Salinimonas sp. HHU 13199]|uniref:Uncharacterized protein n=1 Tax=Salinimonas profundi TaxID=2729140 RepID=A0ABR8LM69_9ALTE|nr:type IV pilin protein [Salinimonas profundi]MBD3587298.1 hypothetical protein [Salinimonas profundi]
MGKQTGLTITDSVIALALVGILAALSVPAYNYFSNQSELAIIQARLMELQNEQQAYRIKHDAYQIIDGVYEVENGVEYKINTQDITTDSFRLVATSEDAQTGCQTLSIDDKFNKLPEKCWR